MATFKPQVSYDGFKRIKAECRACKDQLDASNYGEKINEHVGYAPANSFYLSQYGLFCNPCSYLVVGGLQSVDGKK
mgnify:FL=1|tara:strand:- start:535 stop:762 length:228 start_codon:yes stop_codon:yes gene_type:complete